MPAASSLLFKHEVNRSWRASGLAPRESLPQTHRARLVGRRRCGREDHGRHRGQRDLCWPAVRRIHQKAGQRQRVERMYQQSPPACIPRLPPSLLWPTCGAKRTDLTTPPPPCRAMCLEDQHSVTGSNERREAARTCHLSIHPSTPAHASRRLTPCMRGASPGSTMRSRNSSEPASNLCPSAAPSICSRVTRQQAHPVRMSAGGPAAAHDARPGGGTRLRSWPNQLCAAHGAEDVHVRQRHAARRHARCRLPRCLRG
jgi:hypothetical protein